jgi:hypothetical protein
LTRVTGLLGQAGTFVRSKVPTGRLRGVATSPSAIPNPPRTSPSPPSTSPSDVLGLTATSPSQLGQLVTDPRRRSRWLCQGDSDNPGCLLLPPSRTWTNAGFAAHLRLHARRCGTGEPHFGPGADQTTVLASWLRDPVRGADDDLRLSANRTDTILVGSPGPVPQRPPPVRDALASAGILAGSGESLAPCWRAAEATPWRLELGPAGQSRRGGPAGLSNRSGAQAGNEPAVATDTASLSSAPPGRYRMSTPVHCGCEGHPDACWRSFGIAT